jgi:hypothetical protein
MSFNLLIPARRNDEMPAAQSSPALESPRAAHAAALLWSTKRAPMPNAADADPPTSTSSRSAADVEEATARNLYEHIKPIHTTTILLTLFNSELLNDCYFIVSIDANLVLPSDLIRARREADVHPTSKWCNFCLTDKDFDDFYKGCGTPLMLHWCHCLVLVLMLVLVLVFVLVLALLMVLLMVLMLHGIGGIT